MREGRAVSPLVRARAWLVTGPLGRGLAFAIDFAVAIRTGLARRHRV
jgi:transketolase